MLIQAAVALGAYVLLTALLIVINLNLTGWDTGIAWPLYWMIWVFAYWPIAIAGLLVVWAVRPRLTRSGIVYGCYIAIALAALQLSLLMETNWPMVSVKIAGLAMAFVCITGLPRQTAKGSVD